MLVYVENKSTFGDETAIHIAEFVSEHPLGACWYVEAYDNCDAYERVTAICDRTRDRINNWMLLPDEPRERDGMD